MYIACSRECRVINFHIETGNKSKECPNNKHSSWLKLNNIVPKTAQNNKPPKILNKITKIEANQFPKTDIETIERTNITKIIKTYKIEPKQ